MTASLEVAREQRPVGPEVEPVPGAVHPSLDQLLAIGRGDQDLGDQGSLTALTAKLVADMPPEEAAKPAPPRVVRLLGAALGNGAEAHPAALSRWRAVMGLAVAADICAVSTRRGRPLQTAARLAVYGLLAHLPGSARDELLAQTGIHPVSLRQAVRSSVERLGQDGGDRFERLRSVLADPDGLPSDFEALLPELRNAEPPRKGTSRRQGNSKEGTDEPAADDLGDEDLVRLYLHRDLRRSELLNAEEEVVLAKRIEAGLLAGRALQDEGLFGQLLRSEIQKRMVEQAESGAFVEERGSPQRIEVIAAELRSDLALLDLDGQKAKDDFLEANLRLVVSIAKRYCGRGMPFLDLIQEGNLGLIRAVEKFDYERGYKFSTYATWWIRQAISRAMAEKPRAIRIPVHMVETINKVSRIKRGLRVTLGRDPTPDELAKEADITVDYLAELEGYERQVPMSLDKTVGDGDTEIVAMVGDDDAPDPHKAVVASDRREALETVLGRLPEREAGIMRRRYGLHDGREWSLDECAREFGLSRERIRQLEQLSLGTLRLYAGELESYRD